MKKRMLYDYYPNARYDFDENDNDVIIVNDRKYTVYMTLSPKVKDSECMRVRINGKYYYFG